MTLRRWHLATLVLTALTMGLTFSHVLEAPPKLRWNAELYLAVQTNLYYLFGNVGAIINIGAILSASLLAFLERHNAAFRLFAAGAAALWLALLVWFVMVAPVNAQTGLWQMSQSMPPDWQRWRNQWELGHAVSFVLHFSGFVALLWAALSTSRKDVSTTLEADA